MAARSPHTPIDPSQSRKCTATRRSGTRCTNWAILGGTVCRMHGGGAPQVKAKAAERLRALVDPAITVLQEILADTAHPQRLAAAREVLERDGHIGANKLQVEATITTTTAAEVLRARRAQRNAQS